MNKKHKKILIIVFLAVLVIAGCFVFFQKPQEAEAGWWDDTWLYRKPVAITNSSTAQTDFQVQITLDTATLITANTMQADCDDIRLTDINSNIIPHWMEPGTCNGASTKIWAKVPSIPASNATVYIYYGNPSAASESSVSDTFIREIAGVQGAWDMDEASWDGTPNEVVDASGTGNHGVRAGNATTAAGKFGNGGTFDGTNDYVDCGAGASLEITGAITLAGWVKLNTLDSNQQFFGKGLTLSGNGDYGYGVVFYSPTDKIIFDTHSATVRHNLGYENAITDANWHHIAVTWDGTTNTNGKKIYIDGILKAQGTSAISEIGTPAYNFRVGTSGSGSYDHNGLIDNVRIYNQALTQSEITDLYGTGGDRQGYVTTNYPNKSLVRKFSASVSVGSPGTQEKGPGPVAYWSFDEGYGDTAYDSTDNANNGTRGGGVVANKPTWQTEDMCVSGKCLHFDGTDDYVDCGNDSSLDLTSVGTVEAWIKVEEYENYPGIVGKGGSAGYDTNGYTIWTRTSRIEGTITDKSDPDNHISVEFGKPSLGEWHHYMLVWDGSYVYAYLDGSEKQKKVQTVNVPVTADNFMLGKCDRYASYFNGSIDEVRIYPYARTAAQIKKDYNAGLAGMGGGTEGVGAALGGGGSQKWMTDGLVGYWKMDESSWNGSANEVVDASGAGNHGVSACTGGGCSVPTTGAGKFGSGGVFDGTDDYVDCGAGTSLNITDAITISAWVKSTENDNGVITRGQSRGNSGLRDWDIYGNGTNLIFLGSNGTSSIWNVGGTYPSLNEWHHILAQWDGTTNANGVKIFVDGILLAEGTATGTDLVASHNTYIGGSGTYVFNGSIDQVRIYNRALSPREVRDLYNFAPGPVLHLKMDEKVSGNAQTLYDISTNENNGTTYHGANAAGMDCSIPGKFGAACDFDGIDDWVGVGDFNY